MFTTLSLLYQYLYFKDNLMEVNECTLWKPKKHQIIVLLEMIGNQKKVGVQKIGNQTLGMKYII